MAHLAESLDGSRRSLLKLGALGAAAAGGGVFAAASKADELDRPAAPRSGAVGFTSFVNPSARILTHEFSIGAQSLIEGYVTARGASLKLGAAANLQDNSRLLNFDGTPGDLAIGDGSFTAHGVTFIGKVKVGQACGTVINAVLQNARIGDGSLTGFLAQIRGRNPSRPIEVPDATLVLFGARINNQSEVAANTIPIPAAFSLFASDVDQENVLLARAYNLLWRAASRVTPFSAAAGDPRNPGEAFPDLAAAFGKLTVGPPTVDRRGTGVIPARPATLNDLSFEVFPAAPANDPGPDPESPEAGARFVKPRVASPQLVDDGATLVGGVTLAADVKVGPGSYLHGGDAPAIQVGERTRIGRHSSVHELTFTSVRIGKDCVIGDRAVLHGPLVIGDNVRIGDGSVLFGPTVANGVRIGSNVLAFGPLTITEDVADDTILVPAEQAGLIAPSHTGPRGSLRKSGAMQETWRFAQDCGAGCGCGLGLTFRGLA